MTISCRVSLFVEGFGSRDGVNDVTLYAHTITYKISKGRRNVDDRKRFVLLRPAKWQSICRMDLNLCGF